MDKIEWCYKQKFGIRIIEPNEHIAKDYFKKAEESLTVMQTTKINDWKIISAYYSCYYVLYALLQRIGIKCEIHECSIELMKFFNFKENEIEFIKKLKDKRIDSQYYTKKVNPVEENKIKDFILKCKEIEHKSDFKQIREKVLKEIKNKP